MLAAAAPVTAAPPVTAPPATAQPALPEGLALAPLVTLPATSAFKPRAARWWKAKQPCPAGSHAEHLKIGSEYVAIVCRDRDGKDHGPGVAVFAGTDQAYEDAWSVHGIKHGTRWTWHRDGRLDHVETFVDGKLQGHAEEWTGDQLLAEGAYLDGERHGLWTYHHPNGIVERGSYDRGKAVGTWIGARPGASTATLTGDASTSTWRVFDAAGHLTLERVNGAADAHGSIDVHATAWSAAGVRIAEYDCPASGLVEARFFDDHGALARRWIASTHTLVDAHGAKLATSAEQLSRLGGARDACSAAMWMLEGPPPAREAALASRP